MPVSPLENTQKGESIIETASKDAIDMAKQVEVSARTKSLTQQSEQ